MIRAEQKEFFDQNGYVIVPALFSKDETAYYRDHYMELRHDKRCSTDRRIQQPKRKDPLLEYPRLMMMHRWDEVTLQWMLDPRLNQCMSGLLEREPLAVQTMHYFKPPKARGQALHQDNYYLRVQPGTCLAAWMALDRCDEVNGCLQVVAGSHNWPVLCTEKADTKSSFTDVTVPIPEGAETVPIIMQAGDVLFFNGSLVHGSLPNRSRTRFRRSLIAHYIEGDTERVARWYHPVLRMDGTVIDVASSDRGGQCGVWVTENGKPVVELAGYEIVEKATE
jgi:phytanoyl-CoA hydroxylase